MKDLNDFPKTVYKYRSWSNIYHQQVLLKNEIFLASPESLNDPFDGSIPFRYKNEELTPDNIYKKTIEVYKSTYPNMSNLELHEAASQVQQSGELEKDEYWIKQMQGSEKRFHKEFGIFSTTTKNDNLLMWSHYADSHRGFCVGFDCKKLFWNIDGMASRVSYINNFPKRSLFAKDTFFDFVVLTSKSKDWEYESEFRYVSSQIKNRHLILPSQTIVEVILGCNITEVDKKAILEVLNKKLPHVKVFYANTNLESFNLDIKTHL